MWDDPYSKQLWCDDLIRWGILKRYFCICPIRVTLENEFCCGTIPHNNKDLCVWVTVRAWGLPVVCSQTGMYDYQTALTKVAVCVGALSYGGQIRCHCFITSLTFTIPKRGRVQAQNYATPPLHACCIIQSVFTREDLLWVVHWRKNGHTFTIRLLTVVLPVITDKNQL